MPYNLVIDGKVMYDNLKKINKDYEWLSQQVSKFNIKPEDALIVVIDGKENIACQTKERK